MIGTICHQLVERATPAQMRAAGMDASYINHGLGIHPHGAEGAAWTGSYIQSKGDPITDLYENMAAEQKARSTYENLIDLTNDPDIVNPLLWLRQREIIHFARFKELYDYYKSKGIKD